MTEYLTKGILARIIYFNKTPSLNPNGFCVNEHLFELALYFKAEDLIRTTHQLSSYEHSWYSRVKPQFQEISFQLVPVWKLVQIVHHWVSPKIAYQRLGRVGHAAITFAEYHHRMFGR